MIKKKLYIVVQKKGLFSRNLIPTFSEEEAEKVFIEWVNQNVSFNNTNPISYEYYINNNLSLKSTEIEGSTIKMRWIELDDDKIENDKVNANA